MKTLILDYSPSEKKIDWTLLTAELPNYKCTVLPIKVATDINFDEYIHSQSDILNNIQQVQYDLILCPASISPAPLSYTGLRLGMHIRLTAHLKDARYTPIVFWGTETETEVLKTSIYGAFLSTPQVYYVQQRLPLIKELLLDIAPDVKPLDEKQLFSSLTKYPITPEAHIDSSHSLANEWGAYELDKFSSNILKEQSNRLLSHLYIKYIQQKFNLSLPDAHDVVTTPFSTKGKSILYIDDEWSKGWKVVLEEIFKGATFECLEAIQKGTSRKEIAVLVDAKLKQQTWDLILLDLRLTDEDHGDVLDPSFRFSGEEILEVIRTHNPVLPVIMFTASTKAQNQARLRDKGADGYFVKHGPSDTRTPKKVQDTITDFYAQVNRCFEKGTLLLPYWTHIEAIRANSIIPEKGNTKFKERIEERLKMFLGLLKKAFEQHRFDETVFYYDPKETAFLTLWSVLNEVSECYFEKVIASTIKKHPNNKDVIKEWRLVGQKEQVFIKKALLMEDEVPVPTARGDLFKQDTKSKFIFYSDDGIVPVFTLSEEWEDGSQHERRLFYQIAYIIQHKKQLQESLFANAKRQLGKTSLNFLELNQLNQIVKEEQQKLLTTLYTINNIRNHLYLTHGEDASTTDFGQTLRKLGTKVQYKDIQDLFNLVYFLLTAKLKQQ